MGLFRDLFGGSKNNIYDVETEYKGFLDSVECLAKVGAALGTYDFHMYVGCADKCIYIELKIDFFTSLKLMQSGAHFLDATLSQTGLTHTEYEFFMRNIHVDNKDEMHDIGTAKIMQEFKNAKCSKAVLDVLKSRLANINNTACYVKDDSIFLHDK